MVRTLVLCGGEFQNVFTLTLGKQIRESDQLESTTIPECKRIFDAFRVAEAEGI